MAANPPNYPPSCFLPCNDAYLATQRPHNQSPESCDLSNPNSFWKKYQVCRNCVLEDQKNNREAITAILQHPEYIRLDNYCLQLLPASSTVPAGAAVTSSSVGGRGPTVATTVIFSAAPSAGATETNTQDTTPQGQNSSSINTPLIIGTSLGSLVSVAFLAFLSYFLVRRRAHAHPRLAQENFVYARKEDHRHRSEASWGGKSELGEVPKAELDDTQRSPAELDSTSSHIELSPTNGGGGRISRQELGGGPS